MLFKAAYHGRCAVKPANLLWYDNGLRLVHHMRLDPMPHIMAAELHSIGLSYHRQARPPALFHNMSHLTSGMLINPRTLKVVSNLLDPAFVLKRF